MLISLLFVTEPTDATARPAALYASVTLCSCAESTCNIGVMLSQQWMPQHPRHRQAVKTRTHWQSEFSALHT